MAGKIAIYGIAAAGLLSAITLTLQVVPRLDWRWQTGRAISLQTLLYAPPLPNGLRLFAPEDAKPGAAVTSMERGTDLTDDSGIPYKRYLRNRDGSTETIILKADGEHYASRQSFYSVQPGEIGRRPHEMQIFAADSDLVVDDIRLRRDGTREEHTVNGANGAKHLMGYAANGETLVHELVVNARKDHWSDPVLASEERWRDDLLHSLEYTDSLDPEHDKRTITYWDANHLPLKVISSSSYGYHNGTTTTAYFPGTASIRMHSEVDYIYNMVQYFRPDGSLDHVLKLSQGMTVVNYFDASGKVLLLEQNWDRDDQSENGKPKSTYKISSIVEKDTEGNDARRIFYSSGKLSSVDNLNVEIAGVKYGEVDYTIDQATQTVESIRDWIGKADHLFDKEETHKPSEKIAAPVVTTDETMMKIDPDEDQDLLLPDPISPEGM